MPIDILYSDFDLDTETYNCQVWYKEHTIFFDSIKVENDDVVYYEIVGCEDEFEFPVHLPLSDHEKAMLVSCIELHLIFK